MGYSQFLNMMPEAFLVLALIIVFIADFAIANAKVKGNMLSCLTLGLLAVVTAVCVTANPSEAFGGMYVTTAAANVMKITLPQAPLSLCLWLSHGCRRVRQR